MTFMILPSANILWLWCVYVRVCARMRVQGCTFHLPVSPCLCSHVSVCIPVPFVHVSPVCTQSNKIEGFLEWALPGRRLDSLLTKLHYEQGHCRPLSRIGLLKH